MSIRRYISPSRQVDLGRGLAGQLFVAVALALLAAGCASHRPTPLVVQPQAGVDHTSTRAEDVSLRLVTYNIWGLPWWLNGKRPSRYTQIAQELERLDPDIILLQEAWTA